MELYLHSPFTPSWHGAQLSSGITLPLHTDFQLVIARTVYLLCVQCSLRVENEEVIICKNENEKKKDHCVTLV
jgi:hypothetical protein